MIRSTVSAVFLQNSNITNTHTHQRKTDTSTKQRPLNIPFLVKQIQSKFVFLAFIFGIGILQEGSAEFFFSDLDFPPGSVCNKNNSVPCRSILLHAIPYIIISFHCIPQHNKAYDSIHYMTLQNRTCDVKDIIIDHSFFVSLSVCLSVVDVVSLSSVYVYVCDLFVSVCVCVFG